MLYRNRRQDRISQQQAGGLILSGVGLKLGFVKMRIMPRGKPRNPDPFRACQGFHAATDRVG